MLIEFISKTIMAKWHTISVFIQGVSLIGCDLKDEQYSFIFFLPSFLPIYLCNSSNITFKSIFNNCFKDVHRLILCFTLITWMQLLNILLNHSKSQLKIIFFDDQTWFARMHESKHKNALNQTFIFIHKVRQLLKSLFRLFLFQCQYVKG